VPVTQHMPADSVVNFASITSLNSRVLVKLCCGCNSIQMCLLALNEDWKKIHTIKKINTDSILVIVSNDYKRGIYTYIFCFPKRFIALL
jgi:hypothetical protein